MLILFKNIKNRLQRRMALKHIAGYDLQDAIRTCQYTNGKGFAATIGFWNSLDETVEDTLKIYRETLNAVEALRRLQESNTSYELEQLISLPLVTQSSTFRHSISNFAAAGQVQPQECQVRIYIPFGEPYLPYNIQNVTESPAVIEWFVRDLTNLKRRFNLL